MFSCDPLESTDNIIATSTEDALKVYYKLNLNLGVQCVEAHKVCEVDYIPAFAKPYDAFT